MRRPWVGPCQALSLALGGVLATGHAVAMMAGELPDTPAARVDANTAGSPWSSAVAVLINGGVYSGVVVAPRHVLTASHVAGGFPPAAVTVQVNTTASPVSLAASAITSFPSSDFPYDDLTLITLAAPVPSSVTIQPIYRNSLPSHQALTLVGYGASGNGDVGVSVGASASVKRSGSNAADLVQTTVDSSGRTSLFYLFDFDGPAGTGSFGAGTLGNTLETELSYGDSGSPAFALIDGQRWLIGINTFVASSDGGAVDYRFGTVGGGILLSDPRFIGWLDAQTGQTLANSTSDSADAPLPAWALGTLALALGGALRARHTASGGQRPTADNAGS